MSILVTGGAGFIGSVLVGRLLESDYDVRVVDSLMYDNYYVVEKLRSHPRFEFMHGDVRSAEAMEKAFKDVEGVAHLASIVGAPASEKNNELTRTVNYEATLNIAERCTQFEVDRLVFASTTSVYGYQLEGRVVDENSSPNPQSLYATTKLQSEELLKEQRDESNLPFCCLRIATNFGPSLRPRFDLVVNKFVLQALIDKRLTVYGGKQWRPFMHTHDTARAIQAVLEAPGSKVDGEIFNAGGNEENYTILQVAQIISEELGNQCRVEIMEGVKDTRSYSVDFTKIRDRIGFRLEKNITSGVREVQELIESIKNPYDERYYNYYLD